MSKPRGVGGPLSKGCQMIPVKTEACLGPPCQNQGLPRAPAARCTVLHIHAVSHAGLTRSCVARRTSATHAGHLGKRAAALVLQHMTLSNQPASTVAGQEFVRSMVLDTRFLPLSTGVVASAGWLMVP